MKTMRPNEQRRIILINPRFQGRVAMLFTAIILVGGGLLAFTIYGDARDALWNASVRGHFETELTPYTIVRTVLVRDLAVLFVGLLAASFVLFFLLMRRIRRGLGRLVEVMRKSGDGDLSTPTGLHGPREMTMFGERLDGIRARTLLEIREVRKEALVLEKENLPQEEHRRRWEELKERIGRIAP